MAAARNNPLASLTTLLLLLLLSVHAPTTHAFRFGARPRLPHVTLRIWRRRVDPAATTAAPPVAEQQQQQAAVRPPPPAAGVVIDPKAVGDEGPWVKGPGKLEGAGNGDVEEERRLLTRWCVHVCRRVGCCWVDLLFNTW